MSYLVGETTGGAYGGARKIMYKKDNCSPGETDVSGSCLDKDTILKIAHCLNKLKHTNSEIMHINTKQSPESIHGDICKEILKISDCSSEACWMKIKFLMDELGEHQEKFKKSFKPLMPKEWLKDYNEWLSNFDIEDSIKQHLNTCNEFYFYGAVPIDFHNCSVSNLCRINIKEHLKNGKTKIGIVFNTDPSTESGEHWISMYIDLASHNFKYPSIYYFDSFGRKPPIQVKNLIKKLKKQSRMKIKKNKKKELLYFYNDHSFQTENSQCGMYAIHFIKNMINNTSFKDYLNMELTDELMIQLRNKYFVRF